ncbi:MAG: bifunctional adenosylcobinamide kinase/adenosylcobinamide-phosphate guanylyltransferase [Candidatus Eremiobacterota bacterium]
MGQIIFVTGGASSGKSNFAETSILKDIHDSNKIAYIATGERLDEKFNSRIDKHQKSRHSRFITIEEPLNIASAVKDTFKSYKIGLLECITTWLGNVFFHIKPEEQEKFCRNELDLLFESILSEDNYVLWIVSNEIGLGMVPMDTESRRFRDIHGRINQKIAHLSSEVYFIVSGMAVIVK